MKDGDGGTTALWTLWGPFAQFLVIRMLEGRTMACSLRLRTLVDRTYVGQSQRLPR